MSHAPAETLEHRHRRVRAAFRAQSIDALIVTSLPNVCYLTNFTGSTAIVVLTADGLTFLTDSRYRTAAQTLREGPCRCQGLEICLVDAAYDATLLSLLERLSLGRIGFESTDVTVARHAWLSAGLARRPNPPLLIGCEGLVEGVRLFKDDHELSTLRVAARMLSAVAADAAEEVHRGRTEREVALAIDIRMRRAGFERPAFETIVASGPNSALPHAQPGERTLTEGDVVVLDFGGVYDSYCVDLTRTVVMGRADRRAREVHAAVLAAHDAAIRAVRPGQSRFAIDAAARDELDRRGLGEAFGHGTGHGLGLEVHEAPRIGKRRPALDLDGGPIDARMVFTIEPGAYLPGWGGVRIEDDVVVTDGGVEVLTTTPTTLLEM
jgi:Xaa-Pro aminopeptidase